MTSSSRSPRTSRLAAAGLLLLAGCSSPNAGMSGTSAVPPGRVLFQVEGADHLLVAVAGLDGSGVSLPLEDLPGGDQTNPDWSPDGRRFVVAIDDGRREDLWVANADGSGARRLLDCRASCRSLDDPSWSPDGSRVVYSRNRVRGHVGWGSLEEVSVASGRVTVLLAPRARTFTAGARWSPDGSRVVFERVHKVGTSPDAEVDGITLRVVDRRTRSVGRALTDPALFAATADWSPDGSRIVYSALPGPRSAAPDLFVLRVSGGRPQRLTGLVGAGGYAAEPTWRADGVQVVFSGQLDAGSAPGELLTVGVDGAAPRPLGPTPLLGRHPRVEPGT